MSVSTDIQHFWGLPEWILRHSAPSRSMQTHPSPVHTSLRLMLWALFWVSGQLPPAPAP